MSEEVTAEQIATLKEHGMTVSEPTPEFLAELQAVGATLTEEWAGKAGPAGEEVIAKLKRNSGGQRTGRAPVPCVARSMRSTASRAWSRRSASR